MEGEILEKLAERVRNTSAERDEALRELNQLTQNIPTGLPAPDGLTRIRQAGHRYKRAVSEWQEAIQEQTDYLVNRVVPEDLRKPPGKAAHCAICGAETELYSNGVPICLKCDDQSQKGGTGKRVRP